ncbi:multicopper oxidase domain-containing protein [Planosporangium thailandense]|uniref:Multicopper oxidase domain-containing protein n=1 Tax=Planosporangium thailandense TaxID=765197 RepID=A0ABX0Y961_9ACTN|nr:multicopper oxidase domain-containing protein [Planosporangium thailandense]NJC73804.1 multicopper oxidase domain-containing protein [Planosporangium thailandense]
MKLVPAALRGTACTAVATLALATPAAVAYAAAPAVAPPAAVPAAVPAAAAPDLVIHAGAPVTDVAPAAVRPELPAANTAGPLTSNACVNAVCDLWARAGTTTVSSASVKVWGFSTVADPTAPVSTPGPVLVVNEGDDVTVNVHNQLSGQNLSLAVPEMTGLAPDTKGAAPGGTATYHFKASRPGTYLYEAGHTGDGGRQAAMGLVGALVVKAAAGAAGSRPVAYGAGTAYDDEAVMVLTEIDPALNGSPDPLTFDMRKYLPKYRLINGKAFPETDPVPTDAGRTVLLRYVNAGLLAHPMTTLGLDQSIVGQDSRPTAFPEAAVTVPLAPGRTVDALVNMPKDQDGRKFLVYESGGQLNNNGARAGTSQLQAFGGMLTYLATNPTVVTPDPTGPAVSRVVASPNPASVLAPVTVTADFTDAQAGAVIDKAEVVIDDLSIAVGTSPIQFDPAGFGGATVTGATATIPTTQLKGLTQGTHTLWVRAHDMPGDRWGVVSSTTINLAVTGAATTGLAVTPNPTAGLSDLAISASGDDSAVGGQVTGAEYFIDANTSDPVARPTDGSGQKLNLNRSGATVAAETGTIPATVVAGLGEGKHKVSVHTQDSVGLWGPYAEVDVVVDRTGPTLKSGAIVPGLVTATTTGAPSEAGYLRIDATFTDPVSPPTAGVNSSITAVEGFLDTAGVNGTGNAFQPLDGSFNSATEGAYGLIPLTQFTQLADGTHQIQVHARDAAGNWGPLTALTFTLDRNGPAVSALSGIVTGTSAALTANATDGASAVVAAEWFEKTDPGLGRANKMTVKSTGATTATLSGTVSKLATGDHVIFVRAKDANGTWGKAVSTVVTVNSKLAIFSNTFDTGNANGWSQRVGTVQVAPSTAFGSSPALTVTGRNATYVVDNTPAAERSLHAQFGFAAGTYTTKGTVVDVFQARNSSGARVLVVQYQSTATGIPQLRVSVLTSTGWKYSAWSTIPRTAVTVKVNWTSASSGTATLAVEGATVGTVTGNTSAYRVESDALGVVATSGSNAPTGSAAVDNYTSNR